MRKLALIPLLALAISACQEDMTQPGDGRAASTVPLGADDGDAELMLLGTTRGSKSTTPVTPSTLVEIDPATGATMRTIGSVGYVVNGLEQDPTTGKLYGSTATWDPNHNGLIEIDPVSGAGTPIGTSGWGLGDPPHSINNITVDSEGQMFGWWDGPDDLVAIDKASGVASEVGDCGLVTFMNGLDFDNTDVLYLVRDYEGPVFTVDPATGATTFTGSIGVAAHHGDFHPSSGLYYAISGAPLPSANSPQTLLVADFSTYTVTANLEALDDNIHAVTFYQPVLLPATLDVAFDIKPGSCRNPVNVKAKGVLPAAILGGEQFDVTQVDPASLRLEGVPPLRWGLEDVGTPYGRTPEDAYDCNDEGPDGWDDLTLKFDNQDIVAALGDVEDGEVLVLTLTGALLEEFGGSEIQGQDVVVILKKGKGGKG